MKWWIRLWKRWICHCTFVFSNPRINLVAGSRLLSVCMYFVDGRKRMDYGKDFWMVYVADNVSSSAQMLLLPYLYLLLPFWKRLYIMTLFIRRILIGSLGHCFNHVYYVAYSSGDYVLCRVNVNDHVVATVVGMSFFL